MTQHGAHNLSGTTTMFRALGEPARLSLAQQIASTSEIDSESLLAGSALATSSVYYHLRVLVNAGLVETRKDGRRHVYRASASGLAVLLEAVEAAMRAGVEAA
jgi:ArsR family transcriptional regulator, arsenate/arsenite/antimonite-responsive transcriptional repressor